MHLFMDVIVIAAAVISLCASTARKHCNNPGNLSDGDWTVISADRSTNSTSQFYSPKTRISFTCRPGFALVGKRIIKCGLNGRWKAPIPFCEEHVRCPPPPKPRNGQIIRLRNRKAVVSCNGGFVLHGPKLIVCTHNESRIPQWPHTECRAPRYCNNPGTLPGGNWTVVSADRHSSSMSSQFTPHARINITCRPGFVLVGESRVQCGMDGSWNPDLPTCEGQVDLDSTVAESLGNNTHASSSRWTLDLDYDGGYDIYFAFDASRSVSRHRFEAAIYLAKELAKMIGVGRTRYAACIYASHPHPYSFLLSDQQDSVEDVMVHLEFIASLQGSDEMGRGTATGKALRFVHEEMILSSERYLHRPRAKRILFLFSDGSSYNVANTKRNAQILKLDYKVGIFCIGLSSRASIPFLQNIATEPHSQHMFIMADYSDPIQLVHTITHQDLDFSRCGFNGNPLQRRPSKGRIVGGKDAPLYKWPWQVVLYCRTFGQRLVCGGTLIAPNWVLTAAQCLDTCHWSDFGVYTGMTDRRLIDDPGTTVYELDGEDAVVIHESFDTISLANDIALLRLRGVATLGPEVKTICMPPEDMTDDVLVSPDGGPAYVTGWGITEPMEQYSDCTNPVRGSQYFANHLQQLQIPLVSDEACEESFANGAYRCNTILDFKYNETFCAGYLYGGRDTCIGDSGGPIMRQFLLSDGTKRWIQIGIVSWGEGCAQEGRYGFYTRLSRYIGWIKHHVGDSIVIKHT